MTRLSPCRAVLAIIFFFSAIRLLLAATIGLGVDESYVVAVARSFSLSYFDHPPLHFWLVWLTTHLTGSESPLSVRLPFILLFAGTTWLMFRLTRSLFGEWAGVYAAIFLSISPVFSLSTGSWVLPDGPLMFCLMAAALTLARISFPLQPPKPPLKNWLLAGFWLGLGLLSKYHAIFLVFGFLLFVLTSKTRRPLLLSAGPYLAIALAALLFPPVLIWNFEHGWVSFLFQSGRGVPTGFNLGNLLANMAGQAVWLLPWIWLPLVWSTLKVVVPGSDQTVTPDLQLHRWFLICLAIGPIATFSLIALWGGQGLFHWQAPGYLFLFPLLGDMAAKAADKGSQLVRWWLRGSVAAFLAILLLLGSQTATGWMGDTFPDLFPAGDPTLEALDWRDIAPTLAAKGLLNSSAGFVVSGNWIDAGKLDYALGGRLPVLCLDQSPHQFAFKSAAKDYQGQDALIIGRRQVIGDAVAFAPYFDAITPLGTVPVRRHGRTEFELNLFYASNFKGHYPLPYGQ
ncbi:MAG: glycosyltransferase family 39 protein [Negativicutes bacterium]|nr:glycosyltransferase family 39 protein [Negativicutes bacterium]